MELSNVLIAFGLTLFAGLSTGIGSLLALLTKKTNRTFLSVTLGFSAGVMIYVSMIEIFVKARKKRGTKGEHYTVHRLVESYRNENGDPRQRTIMHLGTIDLPENR